MQQRGGGRNGQMSAQIERGKGARDERVFRRPRERLLPENVPPRPVQGGIQQIFWAAFGYECRTDLLIMDGDPESARGDVTAAVYLEGLEEHLETKLEPDYIFMQDGASIHRASTILEWLQEMGIILMD